MDRFKVVIVDDDATALEQLRQPLEADDRFSVEGVAGTGASAHSLILDTQPDLLFLDVELPDITGMSLLQEIRSQLTWTMRVVFYTAYDKYMIQAIREQAFDYLLKPFLPSDLHVILSRFVELPPVEPAPQPRVAQPGLPPGKTFMVTSPSGEIHPMRPADVGYFRYHSDRKLWEVCSVNLPPLLLRRGVTAEQILLLSPEFVQIHQSMIINMDYLMLIREGRCCLYPPFDAADDLLVSKKFKKELQDRFCW